jgi:subfamily B ATP-binding cassette protein MsbA
MKRFSLSPIWKILLGPKGSNCKYVLLILIPHLIAAVLEGSSFAFMFLAFSSLEDAAPSNFGFLSLFDVTKWGWNVTSMELFYFYIFASIGSQALRGLTSFLGLYGSSLFSLKVQTQTQKQIYSQIFKFSFPFISKYKTGDLTEFAKTPSLSIPVLFETINRTSISFFMSFGLLFVLYQLSAELTFLTFALFTFFIFLQKTLIQKVVHHSKILTTHLFEFSHQTVQSLQGIRPIHIFQRQKYILDQIDGVLDRIVQSSKKAHFWNNIIPTINETVNVLLVGAILVVGSYLLTRPGESTLPNLLTYIALTYRLATRLQQAMQAIGSASVHYGSIIRLNDILDDRGKEYNPSSGETLEKWTHSLTFQNVHFHYPTSSKSVLQNVSFSLTKGTTLAIIGVSGAGKSSILDLILNLHTPTRGKILVDSKCLSSISHESWRQKIGVVSQDTFLFNGNIAENIRFGDFNASNQDIEKASELAGVADFISHLPSGYETIVGERGYKLSGGERQRIALARCLLKNPEILILDEATSNLDSCSEQIIQNSLNHLKATKTLIIVAHRLSTIIKADRILVLEKGEIIEEGNHQELLIQKGRYAKLWELQSDGII